MKSTRSLLVIVNDDPVVLRFLETIFALEGYTVATYPGPAEALAGMSSKLPPELVITDLHMPGINGWQFCRLLRSPEYQSFNTTPILLVSGSLVGEETENIASESGADAFLPLPADRGLLIRTVHNLIRHHAPHTVRRVLIVDDSSSIRSIIRTEFHSRGYQVETAGTGTEALRLFAGSTFDAVIIDYHLPDIQGDELLVSFHASHPLVTYIMITTDPDSSLAVQWLNMGASTYVRKPFDPALLVTLCEKSRKENALMESVRELESRTRDLREREAFLGAVLKSAPVCAFAVDSRGLFTLAEGRGPQKLGIDTEHLVGKPSSDLDTTLPEVSTLLSNSLNGNDTTVSVTIDGAVLEFSGAPIRDSDGLICGAVAVAIDITERHRIAETALHRKQQIEGITATLPCIIFQYSEENGGIVRHWAGRLGEFLTEQTNPARMFEEFIERTDSRDRERLITSIQEPGDAVTRWEFEGRYNAPGGLIWIKATAIPSYTDDGEFVYNGVVIDITSIKQAEEDRLAARSMLDTAIMHSPYGIVIADAPDVRIRFANPAALQLRGGSQHPLIGIDGSIHSEAWQIFRTDGTPYSPENLPLSRAVLRGEITQDEEVIIRDDTGHDHWVIATAAPVRDADDAITAGIVILQDITDRKRTEAELLLHEVRREAMLALYGMGSTTTEKEMADYTLEALGRITLSPLGYIAFTSDDETVLNMYSWSEAAMKECRIFDKQHIFALENIGLLGEALRQRKPIITNDYTAPNPYKHGYPDGHVVIKRHMNLPVFDDGKIVAVAGVGNKKDPYTDKDVRQCELLINFMWSLIKQRRSEETLHRHDEQLKKQNEALLGLMMGGDLFSGDFEKALAAISEACATVTDTSRISIWLLSADSSTIQCVERYESDTRRHSRGGEFAVVDFPVYMHAFQLGEVIAVSDILAEPDISEKVSTFFRSVGIRSVLITPIWLENKTGGILAFGQPDEKRQWTPEEKRFATTMATSVSLCSESSDRLRAQRELLESEDRFSKTFLSTPAPMVVSEIETGRFIDANARWFDMMGHSREETIGHTSYELGIWESKAVRDQLGEQMLKDGAIREQPYRIVTKSGDVRDVLWSAETISLAGRRVMLSLIYDYTEHKRAEDERHRSEVYYRGLFENQGEAILLLGPSTFVDCNITATNLFGYNREQIIGTPPEQLSPRLQPGGQESSVAAHEYITAALDGTPQRFEWVHQKKDGTDFFADISLNRLDLSGERLLLAVVRDISDRKRAEEEHERMQSQLLQAQKMESVGRLAGGIAHDFNNMLNVITGYTELLLEQLKPGNTMRDNLQEILQASRRSADLTRQLLTFARKQTIAPRTLNLNDLVFGTTKMLQRLIGEDIILIWKPGKDIWPITIDPGQVDQILANLSVNARDAITGAGTIIIETNNIELDEAYQQSHAEAVPGDYVQLSVSDTGSGIPKEFMSQIFEPFFTTKELGKGTGLGLATVFGIVKQNNGFIAVYSEPDHGTTFKLFFPRAQTSGIDTVKRATQAPERGTETILLVEDEQSILDLGKTILAYFGYTILAAHTPEEAISIASTHSGPIQLLVTDVIMPQMNGRELRDRIMVTRPGIRCLFMSGYTADVIAHHGVLDEGIFFVQKPFSITTLASSVRAALDTESPEKTPS